MTESRGKIRIGRSALVTMVLGALSLGIFLGAGVISLLSSGSSERNGLSSRNSDGEFRFIRKGIERNPSLSGELKPFRYKVNALIQEKLARGAVSAVSVYFRDLNNGNWMGIGERDRFSPKNRLKMPLMMAYFKWAEVSPVVLRRSLTCTGEAGDSDDLAAVHPPPPLEPGRSYAVNDLIFRMMAHDDPSAYRLLLANIPARRLERVFRDLNVEYDPKNDEDPLSLRAAATFYRVLFNASYLSEEMSEKALRFLSRSTFRDGMASAIPASMEIASKAGKRNIAASGQSGEGMSLQLHEVGIIYHPERPFLLAIMVRGAEGNDLTLAIREITRLIYEEVDEQSRL
jgi:beta-lactamase class A